MMAGSQTAELSMNIYTFYFFQCDRQASLNAFFDGILSDPGKIGVIGCGCSVASEPVAEIIHNWNIPLVLS